MLGKMGFNGRLGIRVIRARPTLLQRLRDLFVRITQ